MFPFHYTIFLFRFLCCLSIPLCYFSKTRAPGNNDDDVDKRWVIRLEESAVVSWDLNHAIENTANQNAGKPLHICQNRIAKSQLAFWLAIKERVFSVELHMWMNGYCWRESRAKKFKNFKVLLAIFRTSLLRNSSHYILNTIFCNCEALTGFFVDLVFNTGTFEIFLSLEDFSCWLSTPHFAKGRRANSRYSLNERIFL